jgi:hypothetical protein
VPLEASADSPGALDGGPDTSVPSPCPAGGHAFCLDFDVNAGAAPAAYDIRSNGGATLDVDGVWFHSPPRSGHVRLDPSASPGSFARVEWLSGSPTFKKQIHFAYDLLLAKADPATDLQTDILVLHHSGPPGDTPYELDTTLHGTTVWMAENTGAPAGNHADKSVVLTSGKWAHVEIDVALGPSTTVSFSVDGTTLLSPTALAGAFPGPPATVTMAVGLEYASKQVESPVEYAIDNVTIDGN